MVTIVKESNGRFFTETECYGGAIDTREHETRKKAEDFAEMCNFIFK